MAASLHHHCHSSLLFLQPSTKISCTKLTSSNKFSNSHFRNTIKPKTQFLKKNLKLTFALTDSDSPKSLDPEPQFLLQDLANSFDLASDYLAKLPSDLRLDLNDAAFDLSNGPVLDECGQELGETLLNLARAWELADTSTSATLAKKLSSLETSLTGRAKSALGKRLVSSGRRFQSMGQYGQGELQRIAKTMISVGKLFSETAVSTEEGPPKDETRTFKFGSLQVELTPGKAYTGAAIAVVFGILSWEVSQGIQAIPENSLQYANENAVLLGKSLRGSLLAMFYASTVLSSFSAVGLVLLGIQLNSKDK